MRIMKAFLLPLALSFGACSGDDEPSVEAWVDGAWTPVAVTAYAIDGKPRRVGDTLDTGWTVMSINGKDFSVTLRHTTGKEIREGLNKD